MNRNIEPNMNVNTEPNVDIEHERRTQNTEE
jgi:hypothetical protein